MLMKDILLGLLGGAVFAFLIWLAWVQLWSLSYQEPTFSLFTPLPFMIVFGAIVGAIVNHYDGKES